MRGPRERNGPASAANTQPGHDLSFVSFGDQKETYSEQADLSISAERAQVLPFRANGRTVRAICVVPDGANGGDLCRSVLFGRPLHYDLALSFRGPLWKVQMMLKDYRQGLPVQVHPDCIRRAGA